VLGVFQQQHAAMRGVVGGEDDVAHCAHVFAKVRLLSTCLHHRRHRDHTLHYTHTHTHAHTHTHTHLTLFHCCCHRHHDRTCPPRAVLAQYDHFPHRVHTYACRRLQPLLQVLQRLVHGDLIHTAKLRGHFEAARAGGGGGGGGGGAAAGSGGGGGGGGGGGESSEPSTLPWPLVHALEAVSNELRRVAELTSITARQRLFPVFWVNRAANPRWYMLDKDGFYSDVLLLPSSHRVPDSREFAGLMKTLAVCLPLRREGGRPEALKSMMFLTQQYVVH
jgi:hypothetical protein